MFRKIAASGALFLLTGIEQARACPFCNSEVGEQVAAGIFNSDFVFNAILTLLPLPTLLLIVAFIHFGPSRLIGKTRVRDGDPNSKMNIQERPYDGQGE